MKASQNAQRASARTARRKKKAEVNASQKAETTTTLRQTAAELIAQGDAAGAVDLLGSARVPSWHQAHASHAYLERRLLLPP